MNQWQKRLLTLLNIEPGEGRLVGLMLAYAILLYGSNVLARTASYALFLNEFDAKSLPIVYVGISIAAPVISVVYMRLNHRYPLSFVLVIVHGFLLLTLIAYGLGLAAAAASWVIFSLPIYFGVNNSLTISSFWNLLGRTYNLQQGKRLFGLLSSGEHIATIVIGFLTPLLVLWFGTSELFWVAALLMMATAVMLMIIIRKNHDKLSAAEEPASVDSQARSNSLLGSPYVRLIIGLFALFIIGVYIVDIIFYGQVEQQFPTEDEMAAFIGLFFGVFGALSLITQIFVAGRVLNRYGVRAMILATPVGLLIIMTLFSLVGALTAWAATLFWLIVIANMYRSILDAIDSAAVNVMYQPLPAQQRTQAQTFVIGVVYPISIGVTGLLLLFFTNLLDFTPVMLSFLLLFILIAWLAVGLRLGRAYPRQLQQALNQRIFGEGEALELDESGLNVVRQGLASPHVGVVLYSLETLAASTPEALGDLLVELLQHPLPEIRLEALQRIERMHLTETIPAIRQYYRSETDPAVLAGALRTLATLDEGSAMDEVAPYLADANPQIRQGAMVGLLHNIQDEVKAEAENKLADLVDSTEVADRILAGQVIGEVANPDQQSSLAQLLVDEDIQVRRVALMAAGNAGYVALWPRVVEAVRVPETRLMAGMALIAGGESTLPAIKNAFNPSEQDEEVMVQLARICGRIGGKQSIDLLLVHIDYPDDAVRRQVLAALGQCGFRASQAQQPLIERQINGEAERAAETLATLIDLEEDEHLEEHSLLLDALHNRLTHLQENIFHLLSFISDPLAIRQAWEVLRPDAEANEEQRAYALETISITVAKELRNVFLPLINGLPLKEQLIRLKAYYPQSSEPRMQRLRELLSSQTLWLQLCAVYELGRLRVTDEDAVRDMLGMALAEPGAIGLMEETVVWTLAQLEAEKVGRLLAGVGGEKAMKIEQQVQARRSGHDISLPTLKKVAILKQGNLFAQTEVEAVRNAAALLAEVRYGTDEQIFRSGDQGDSMYIIVAGRVRIHEGPHTFNFIEGGDAFGEMALLDREPRSASATAVDDTHLLRLDHDPFFEFLENHPGITRGIIHVLSRFLRGSVRELTELQGEKPRAMTPMAGQPPIGQENQLEYTLKPVERMVMLKQVDMFRRLPNTLLAQLAVVLQERNVESGATVFEKGSPGEAMYIIARGKVRVHDGDHTLNTLAGGEIFGEMALMDSAVRLASVTAVEPTHLLRLDQAPFFELLDDHVEMAEGIIRVLSGHLRSRVRDLTELKGSLNEGPGDD